jgi:ATP-dependent DNA helicase RecQ
VSIHTEAWQCVEAALESSHDACPTVASIARPHRRLLDALRDPDLGGADLAVLVRHVLGWEDVRRSDFGLRTRPRSDLPDRHLWSAAGVSTTDLIDGRIYLQREPWAPIGDETAALRGDPLREVYLEGESAQRRRLDSVPPDPFWTYTLGYADYQTAGQRQAALSLATAPPGATLVVNLPTSTGKTSLAFAPGLLRSEPVGVSVVVVPTVVLALDQERRLREIIATRRLRGSPSGRYAYLGDMADEEKAAIREAVRSGEQRLVFTSPEAFTTGLAPALHAAAKLGHLRYLIVDEAHIIDHWGVDFRPEFQAMVGLRRSLIDESADDVKPVTVLMTGTLSASTADTLHQLFADDRPFQLVSSSALRCEPEYFISRWASAQARLHALREHLLYLPRPAIIYVSKPDQVDEVQAAMTAWGFHRHAGVSGRSGASDRRRVVEGWRADAGTARYDVVVATSAFGLGVDMPDVRAVIHACEPETIDRFYQEVGRGGRDGYPSVSCLLLATGDRRIAHQLATPTLLLPDTAQGRWEAMLHTAQALPSTRILFDLDSRPPNVTVEGPSNRDWNVCLLTALARTGVLDLVAREDAEAHEDVSDQNQVGQHIEISIKHEVEWADYLAERQRIAAASDAGLEALTFLEEEDECVGEVLHRWYSFSRTWGSSEVPRSCRGCPSCRRNGRATMQGLSPLPWVADWRPNAARLTSRLEALMPRARLTVLLNANDEAQYRRIVGRVLVRLIVAGISHVLDVGNVIPDAEWLRLQMAAGPRPLIRSSGGPSPMQPPIPTVAVLPFDIRAAPANLPDWFERYPALVLLVPSDLTAPSRPHIPWSDLHPPCVSHVRLLEDL